MSRSRRPVTGGWAWTTGEKLGRVTHGDSARLDSNRASPDDGDLNGRGGTRVSVAVDLMQPSAPGSPAGGEGAGGGLRQTVESAIRREVGGRGGTGAGPPRDTVFVAGGMLGRGGGEPPIQGNHDGPPRRH